MADKEIIIEHDRIRNSQTITDEVEKEFKKHGLDIHKNEIVEMEDDFKKGIRRYKVKNVKYFYVKKEE